MPEGPPQEQQIREITRHLGQPLLLTPEISEAICQLIEVGNTKDNAAAVVGIHRASLYSWLKRGRECVDKPADQQIPDDVIYREFFVRAKMAEARAEARMVSIIALTAERDWRAAAFYLERRSHRQWAQRNRTTLAGDAKHPVAITAVSAEQAETELLRRLASIRERYLEAGETVIRLVGPGEGSAAAAG